MAGQDQGQAQPPSSQGRREVYNAGDRYEIRENVEPKHADYPSPCFDVLDNQDGKPAVLPNAVLCWCMPHDDALDALIELRGGDFAEALRS